MSEVRADPTMNRLLTDSDESAIEFVSEQERPELYRMIDSAMNFAVENASNDSQWLVDFIGRIVTRGEAAHKIELSKPAVGAALQTIYHGNNLIRLEDYDEPGRKWTSPILSRFVGNAYLPNLCPPLEAGMFALRAELAVDQWIEYLADTPPTIHDKGQQEPDQHWKYMAKRLRLPQSTLLDNFALYVDTKLEAQEEEFTESDKRDIIQTQQSLMPLAILRIAYQAYLEDDPEKASNFAEHFSGSLGEFDKRGQYLHSLPFESEPARRAFAAACDAYSEWCLIGPEKKRDRFFVDLIEQSMAMHMLTNLRSGSAFGIDVQDLFNGARDFTESAIIGADIENPIIVDKFNTFTAGFKAELNRMVTERSTKEQTAAAVRKILDRIMTKRTAFLIQLDGVMTARNVLYGVADGIFTVPELTRLAHLAAEKPLEELATRVEEVQEMFELWEVKWQIAPPHKGLRSPRETDRREFGRATHEREADVEIDLSEGDERLEWLKSYMKLWTKGRSVLVRSKMPGLKYQYHIALLSEELPNGDVVWHGIADNIDDDSIGEHAVLVWRAEAGYDEYGRQRFSWDKVYKLRKDEMKTMGIIRMLHNESLRDRLLHTVFYRSPDSIPPYSEENYASMLRMQAEHANRGYEKS